MPTRPFSKMIRIRPLVQLLTIICLAGCLASAICASPRRKVFVSEGRQVAYEEFRCSKPTIGTLVLMHGASGPQASFYRQQAEYFAGHGYCVLLLHYFDATKGPALAKYANYQAWSQTAIRLIDIVQEDLPASRIGLLGYSLGASVALAAGSRSAHVAAIVEWYGSLPDGFVDRLQALRPF